jgi:hypothetical protein
MRSPIHPAAFAAILTLAACGGTQAAPEAAPAALTPSTSPWDTTGLLRVRFARGTTSGLVNDSLQAGDTRGYLIGAEQGQVMMVHAITWPVGQGESPAATVRVYSVADGSQLTAPAGAGPLWSGRLPSSGDYTVQVSATGPTSYTLAVQIPRRLTPTAGDPTAAIAGTAPSRAPVDYIVAGEGGQTLAASVRESDPVTLHLYGLDDGEQLAPLPERRRLWAGRLPATQDYVVSVVPADEGAMYELTVTLR